mmetsp:Transcript_21400/g.47428  ORF Transcript_21400/g.47428 Transcript_21400/m.47428 type:complete len:210 (-) Transcript_21400:1077-1706(-)
MASLDSAFARFASSSCFGRLSTTRSTAETKKVTAAVTMGSTKKRMAVRLAKRPTCGGAVFPKDMSVTISRPATKVPNSTQPKAKIVTRPDAQPARVPVCVARLPRPMKTGMAMLSVRRSAMRNKLRTLKPMVGSLVASAARAMAGMFASSTKSCPMPVAMTGLSFLAAMSWETTETRPVCRESTEDATMQTESAKATHLMKVDCPPRRS